MKIWLKRNSRSPPVSVELRKPTASMTPALSATSIVDASKKPSSRKFGSSRTTMVDRMKLPLVVISWLIEPAKNDDSGAKIEVQKSSSACEPT